MRFFIIALRLHLKQTVFTKFFIFSAALSLLLTLACGAFFAARENGAAVNVGIIYDESSRVESEIYGNLAAGGNIRLIVFKDRALLEKDVANASLECGYILGDADKKVSQRDYSDLAALVKSPASVLTGFTNELFYTAVLKSIAGNAAHDYLTDAGINISLDEIQKKIRAYYDSGVFMQTIAVNPDNIVQPRGISLFDPERVLRGAIAFAAFIFIFFSAAHVFDEQGQMVARLGARSLMADGAARFAAVLGAGFLSSLGGMICAAFFFPAILQNICREALYLTLYLFCLTCLGFAITAVIRSGALYSVFSVTIITAMVFGGYFIDLNGINAALGRVQSVFPGAWYQDAALGSQSALLTGSAILMGIALLAFLFRRKACR